MFYNYNVTSINRVMFIVYFKFRWKNQFKEFLQDVGYVSPGKRFNDVKVLFMGVECFERLSNEECDYIYNTHQKNIIEKAKINFQVNK